MERGRCLVTGSTGFIGSAVIKRLVETERFAVRAAVRREAASFPASVETAVVGELGRDTPWQHATANIDIVVHLAARVHVLHESADDPLGQFRRVNVEGTLSLARAAVRAGVRRFVFVSSVGVNGNETVSAPFSESDPPNPRDAYGASKHEAEVGLRQLGAETGMEVVIVRPPLVYGPNAPGNFGRLCRAVQRRLPLPFGAIDNRRSLIGLDNLTAFILTCVAHPAAANETLLVSDGEDLSTTDLIRRLARAMGHTTTLIPMPTAVLMMGAKLLGKRDLAQRLVGSLQVDTSKARSLVAWMPPVSVDEGLRRAALRTV